MPDSVQVLLQVGADDVDAGRGGADAFWSLLATHPNAAKRYQVIGTTAGFVADHAAPKRADTTARHAFWLPLDTLVAGARRASSRSA
jgi:predicted Zn-dependent protease